MRILHIIFKIDLKERKETKEFFRDSLPSEIKKSYLEIPNVAQLMTLLNNIDDKTQCYIWIHSSRGADTVFEGTIPRYVVESRDFLNDCGINYREVTRDPQAAFNENIVHINQMPEKVASMKSYSKSDLLKLIDKKPQPKDGSSSELIEKVNILFIGSSPLDLDKLRIEEEADLIRNTLKDNPYFQFSSVFGTRSSDLQKCFINHKPSIVHFACHSNELGIFLEEEDGSQKKTLINYNQLKDFFSRRRTINCVIFNSCSTTRISSMINEFVPNVIHIREGISDKSSLTYSSGFYNELSRVTGITNIDFLKAHTAGKENLALLNASEEYSVEIVQTPKLD